MELNSGGYFDPTRLFKDPKTMTDDELEQEYRALQSQEVLGITLNPNVDREVKNELKRQCFEVEQEYKTRRNEEWIYPITEFFF